MIATDNRKSFALIVNYGRPKRMNNYEIHKKHIMPGILLLDEENISLTYTTTQMGLIGEAYKSNSEEAYEHLEPIYLLYNRYESFLEKNKGFKKFILQDYINMFMENAKTRLKIYLK